MNKPIYHFLQRQLQSVRLVILQRMNPVTKSSDQKKFIGKIRKKKVEYLHQCYKNDNKNRLPVNMVVYRKIEGRVFLMSVIRTGKVASRRKNAPTYQTFSHKHFITNYLLT